MNKASKGFTLIELVVVITILGILAAFAIPRFAGLEREARIATVQGLAGSVRSAATLAHSLSLAQGLAPDASVTMEGAPAPITMANRYPEDTSIINTLVDTTGFTFAAGVFTKDGAEDPDECSVTYVEAPANGAPTITVDVDLC
jgi:MSHA pilin protein MshA